MRTTLRHRGFRRLFGAQVASLLGDAVYTVAVAFAVLHVTGSASALGLVLGSGSAVLVGALLVGGVWADRLPRLPLMITSDVVRALTQGAMALLVATGHASLASLVALNAVHSLATAFFQPALTAVVPQLLTRDHLLPANSLLQLAQSSTKVVGAALAGVLVATVGSGAAIALDAVTFVVSALLLLSAARVSRLEPLPARDAKFVAELREGFAEVRSRRWLWVIVLNATLFLMLYVAPLLVVGPLLANRVFGGPAGWGAAEAFLAIGTVAGAAAASWRRLRRPMSASLWTFLVASVVPVLIAWNAAIGWILLAFVVNGVSYGLFDTVWHTALQREIPQDRLARVSSWDWMGSLAGMPIGFALAGVVFDRFGTTVPLYCMAGIALILNLWLWALPEVRSLGDRPRRAGP